MKTRNRKKNRGAQLGWRILLIAAFLPVGLPMVVCLSGQVTAAALAWLACGPDKHRTERILSGRPASLFLQPLNYLVNQTEKEITA
jgi:hypothetical protein